MKHPRDGYQSAHLALEDGLVVHRTAALVSTGSCEHVYLDSRVHRNTVRPVVVGWCQTTHGRWLERTAVWVLGNVTGFIVDDRLYKSRQLFVLREDF